MPRKKRRSPKLQRIHLQVGKRLRQRRLELGMTQEKLGRMLGISYPQLQKYEHGTIRVSAAMLWIMADVLAVDMSYFFAELDSAAVKAGLAVPEAAAEDDMAPSERETLELIKGYQALQDRHVRRTVRNMISALTRSGGKARQRKRVSPAD